jgi:ribosome-associated protein
MTDTSPKKDIQKLQRAIVDGLEDVKAQQIEVFNTEKLSALFERVMVASGTSNRQTKALAASVRDAVREAGFPKPRVEGEDNGEWIIVDCGQAVVHIMQPAIRQYYNLEELWGETPVRLKFGAPKPAVAAPAPAKKAAAGGKAAAGKTTTGKAASSSAPAKGASGKKPTTKTTARPATKTSAKPASRSAASKTAAQSPSKSPSNAAAAPTPKPATKPAVKVVGKVAPRKAAAKAAPARSASAKSPSAKSAPAKKAAPRRG